MKPDWFESHDELLAFARALVAGVMWSADELLAYLEKPWKWTEEHAAWIAAGRPAEFDVFDKVSA